MLETEEKTEKDYNARRAWLKTQPILRDIYNTVYEEASNCLICITGKVRSGKSHTAVQIARLWDKDFTLEESLVFSVTELYDKAMASIRLHGEPISEEKLNMMDAEELRKAIAASKPTIGKVIIFDEAAHGAYVREFLSTENKNLNKLLIIWGILRLVVIFVIPNKVKLADTTIREFLDYEIRMTGKKKGVWARCRAYKYTGWNERTKMPYREKLVGNTGPGFITVWPLPDDLAAEYWQISWEHKMAAILHSKKTLKSKIREREGGNAIPTKEELAAPKRMTEDDYLAHLENDLEAIRGPFGRLDWMLIHRKLKKDFPDERPGVTLAQTLHKVLKNKYK